MTADRVADWVDEMLRAARQACDYVKGMKRGVFLADTRTQQAVAMNLLIMGEVAAKLIERHPKRLALYPEVPWVVMKGLRNRIAHGYFEIDMGVVWETVRRDLPGLIERLSAILAIERGADHVP